MRNAECGMRNAERRNAIRLPFIPHSAFQVPHFHGVNMTFCTDIDLLYWEPNLFRDAAFASQTLLAGIGDVAGSTFTIDAGSLATSHITANMVIAITSGSVAGCYPIISVNSATQLTLGVLHDPLFPEDGAPATSSPIG